MIEPSAEQCMGQFTKLLKFIAKNSTLRELKFTLGELDECDMEYDCSLEYDHKVFELIVKPKVREAVSDYSGLL